MDDAVRKMNEILHQTDGTIRIALTSPLIWNQFFQELRVLRTAQRGQCKKIAAVKTAAAVSGYYIFLEGATASEAPADSEFPAASESLPPTVSP